MLPEETKKRKAELFRQAKAMGLKPHGRTGIPKLEEMIRAAETTPEETPQSETDEEGKEAVFEPVVTPSAATFPKGMKLHMSEEEFNQAKAEKAKLEAGKLVRVRITCMNPDKKDWTGEICSVGSSFVGTFKKFIPFNLEEPYHIPKIIFEHLKERKCAIRNVRKTPDGKEHIDVKMIPEFAIDVLSPLTPKELEDLRKQQAMARGVG